LVISVDAITKDPSLGWSPTGSGGTKVINADIDAAAAITSSKLGFGTWEKVADTVIAGAAVTSIDFSGLDLDAAKAYMITVRITNTATGAAGLNMFFNDDTTQAHYYEQSIYASGAVVASYRGNDASVAYLDPGNENTAVITIARGVGKVKSCVKGSNREQAAIETNDYINCWVTEANVTRITFTASAANTIGIGSRIMIFKVSQ